MNKILYSLLALLLFSNVTFAQLMSDEDHRIMMNTFAANVNTVLMTECPQGMSLDQFKKNIVTGVNALSNTAKSSINTYATPLMTYAQQFKTANNLSVDNTDQLYFLSSFAPSTVIQNGKLVESTTTPGLTATEMWTCAMSSFNTGDCNLSGLVSDTSDIQLLAKAATTLLTKQIGITGVWVMIGGFRDCMRHRPENFDFIGKEHNRLLDEFYNQAVSNNIQKDSLNSFLKSFAMSYAESKYNYSQAQKNTLENIVDYSINVLPLLDMSTDFYSNLPNNGAISTNCKRYLDNLHNVLFYDQIAPVNICGYIQIIEQNAYSDRLLSNNDLSILYSATSVFKNSIAYWGSNAEKWSSYFPTLEEPNPNTDSSRFCWKCIWRADGIGAIKSFLDASGGTVPGAGLPTGATINDTIAGAVSASITKALEQL